VASTAQFLRDKLELVAELLTKDEGVLGNTREQRTALIDLAVNVLNLERSNVVTQQHIDNAVRQARQGREETAVAERERQRQSRLSAEAAAGEGGDDLHPQGSSSQPAPSSRKRLLDSGFAAEATKKMIAAVDAATKRDMAAFDAKADVFMQELQESLLPEEGDAEVTLQRVGPSANDFLCPYATVRMAVPMANTNPQGKCGHHMDQASLPAFFGATKKREAKRCPVGGCAATWAPQWVAVDAVFQRKMARFFAKEGSGGGSGGGSFSVRGKKETEVRDLDEDEEEE